MKALALLIAPIALLAASCSADLRPYSTTVHRQANLGPDVLQQIQFYVSDDIVLHRQLRGTETSVSGGVLRTVNGREVEEVRIPSGTPGLVVGMEGTVLLVSFDSDGSYLRFGPNQGAGGKYTLMAADWDGRNGKVAYGGSDYQAVGTSHYAHLLLDMERMERVTIATKEASGRTLSP